jgi:hypothetical protein
MSNEATSIEYIEKITESGTAHQRIMLLATSVAHWAFSDVDVL